MLWVNVADTPYKQEQGLMFVKDMSSDAGMLFKFPQPKKLSFWGLNTYIPLDVAFVNSKNKIVDIQEIKPFNMSAVSCDKECTIAIEANAGYFYDNGIKVGDVIEMKQDPYEGDFVVFNNASKIKEAQSYTDQITVEEAERMKGPPNGQVAQPQLQSQPLVESEPPTGSQPEQVNTELEQLEQQEPIVIDPEDIQFASEEDFQDQDGYPEVEQNEQKPEPPQGEYPEFVDPKQLIDWAEAYGQSIWIDYTTLSGVNIQRNIQPQFDYTAGTGNQIVVAFDETVNAFRSFIINKINDFQILGRTFTKELAKPPSLDKIKR